MSLEPAIGGGRVYISSMSILRGTRHKGYALDGNRRNMVPVLAFGIFDELYEEIKDIRTSERMIYQKITDIYATAIDYSPNAFESKKFLLRSKTNFILPSLGKTVQK